MLVPAIERIKTGVAGNAIPAAKDKEKIAAVGKASACELASVRWRCLLDLRKRDNK